MPSEQTPIHSGFGPVTTAREVLHGIDLSGKIAIVTGGYSGIGLETTRALAEAGATVVVPARTAEKARQALRGIPRVEQNALDLLDPASIDAFAAEFLATCRPLHMLINNAGIMATPLTRDARGYESQFSANHLGHFQLTARLWPALCQAGGARVVSVSSRGHQRAAVDFDDPNFERRRYNRWVAYFQSKLANLLFATELQRRLAARGSGTTSLVAHPGHSHTELGVGDGGVANRVNTWGARFIAMPAEKGALPFLRAATDPTAGGGTFWGPKLLTHGSPQQETPSTRARDTATAAGLWDLSETLTGVSYLS